MLMKIVTQQKQVLAGKPAGCQHLKVRSDLRSGATGCELGIDYWRKEYNYWKNLAQQMGCM
jgi:hypothetical protein